MSQHDMTIDDQTFPAFRADLNLGLKALASNSSGTGAPATTYANQFWYDTATDTLKMRNETNTAWISLFGIDQANALWSAPNQARFIAGSAAAPGIAFTADPTTGLMRTGAGAIGFVGGGTEAMRLTGAQLLRLGAPAGDLSGAAYRLQLAGTSNASGSLSQFVAVANINAPIHVFAKSRGVATDDYALVAFDDVLGVISFRGADGTGLINSSARIESVVAGTPAAGDVRADLRFFTGSGPAQVTEALAININQAVLAKSPTGGMGYGAGAGGAVTQLTSKATGVTLNKVCGPITTHNAALAANTVVYFTLTNSTITAFDVPSVAVASPSSKYSAWVAGVSAGSCVIGLRNDTAGSLSEAVVINFKLGRAVNA